MLRQSYFVEVLFMLLQNLQGNDSIQIESLTPVIAMENGPGLKMYFLLLKMVILRPSMLVCQRVSCSFSVEPKLFGNGSLPAWDFRQPGSDSMGKMGRY